MHCEHYIIYSIFFYADVFMRIFTFAYWTIYVSVNILIETFSQKE